MYYRLQSSACHLVVSLFEGPAYIDGGGLDQLA